ncbi:EF-hand domain-containing protein [Litoreibacter arenae]|uniref:EF hand domain protein n=1 Tax=Litoreibacter arenae DSM 19593 TaxID=1123360 RepID=S9QMH9_9RHOB|nr:EF-hand domain-containing protein [Litoreibacter arenae]EPX80798.1 EF hand domain protein [Litoreibacter arenae DSM 19593]
MSLLNVNLKAKLLLAGLGVALAVTPMIAQAKGAHSPRASFEEFDADGDGRITEAEMLAHREARFAQADSDGNGLLSRDELQAAAESRRAQRFDRMIERFDTDKDGSLSQAEIAEMGGERRGRGFTRMDADGDGVITKAEFEQRGGMRRGGKRHGGNHYK